MLLRSTSTLLLLASAAASAQAPALFEAPWMAYNAGYFIQAPMGGGDDGRWPAAVTAADLNGDGRADLVLTRDTWNAGLAVFLSTAGDYAEPVFYPEPPGGSRDVVATDLDGDGDLDLVTSDGDLYNTNRRGSVYRNRGDGTFDPPAPFETQAAPMALVAADLDGDGHPDLATADFDWPGGAGYVSVLIGQGDGSFAAHRTFAIPVQANDIAAGDLDGDGDLDLVVAHNERHVSVLFNDGTGHFGAAVLLEGLGFQASIAYASVVLVDLNGDGDLDIAAGHNRTGNSFYGYDEVALFDNQGNGTFAAPRYARLSQYRGGPSALTAGDVNGDGYPDLFAASPHLKDVRFLLNDGAGSFLPAETIIGGQWARGLALGDADGDGDSDLVTADGVSMAATVHLNDGTGRYPGAPVVRAIEGWGIADTGDLNGDGHLDVFTVVGGTAYTYLGDGAGAFASGPVYNHSHAMLSARLRDLDGDGVLDLLFAANQPGSSSIYDFYTAKGNGDGSFGQASRWIAGAGSPPTVYAFDFDGDGDRDVLIMVSANNLSTSPVRIYRNDGAGFFSFANEFDVEAGPSNATAGDFNQDGRLDFATAHKGAYGAFNSVNVHLGNGDLTFQPWVHYTVGFGPAHIETADLNGDGLLDLVTGNIGVDNTGDETVSVLIGQSGGTFAPAFTYYAPYDYEGPGLSGLAVGDADGDGDLDLMTSSRGSNDVAFYENQGDGTFTFRYRYGIGERASSLYYADVTGDGAGDLLSVTHGYAVYSPYLTVLRGTGGAVQAPVAVSAQPVGGPVTIGPGGGSFQFRVTLTNTTSQPQTFQAWTAVTGPANREPVVGPQTVTLPPGATVTKTLRQQVPGYAPAGAYTYHVRLGSFGGAVMASDSFPFTKQGSALATRGADAAEAWAVSGSLGEEAAASASAALAEGYALSEAHPNPSGGRTRLTLDVAQAQHVRAEVYDALGRRVAVLLNGEIEAGTHMLVFDGSALPAGVYVVRVTGEAFATTRRATLLK